MATTRAIHISRDRFHLAWDPAIEPIETVDSGAVVEFDLLDASGGQLTASSTIDDLARLDFNRVDQVNGPIAVVGAEPGDTLQVDLLEFEPIDGVDFNTATMRAWAASTSASVSVRSSAR